MSDGNLGQPRVLRSCVATRPFRGLGFVEERTRGIHQGWKVSVLSEKAEYMSATEPSFVIINNHLAMGVRSIYVATFPLRVFRYASPLIVRWRRGGMIDFKGSQFEREIILWAVRWYVAYPISYRQLEEMMGERGVAVDHSTLNRWVIKYAPEFEKAFRRRQRPVGRSWRMDETYVKIKGKSAYLYRAVVRSVPSKWRQEPGMRG